MWKVIRFALGLDTLPCIRGALKLIYKPLLSRLMRRSSQ